MAQAAPPAATPPAAGGDAAKGPMRPPRPAFNPRNMCMDMTARKVGHIAYLKARLDLKPEQMNAWNAFEKASDDVAAKDKARCATMPTERPKDPPKFSDRMDRREEMMKARYDAFEAVKPSLMALYAALTPEQQALFDRPMGGPGGGRHGHWRG
jgi:hypothetical protein